MTTMAIGPRWKDLLKRKGPRVRWEVAPCSEKRGGGSQLRVIELDKDDAETTVVPKAMD